MPVLWDEPFGLVMAEAMACGTPVIGLRRGAVPEVVETEVTGFVVDNLEQLVAATERVHLINRVACRARVERWFSDTAMTDGYIELYTRMISQFGSSPKARRLES